MEGEPWATLPTPSLKRQKEGTVLELVEGAS